MSNVDIEQAAAVFPHFRGVFMRDSLPGVICPKECGIVNLDSSSGDGTHWVAYGRMGLLLYILIATGWIRR